MTAVYFPLLALTVLVAASVAYKDTRCFPPVRIVLDDTCKQDETASNPNYNCQGGFFVQTAGIHIACETDRDCFATATPNEWCNAGDLGYQMDISGCHCDRKLKACTMQRFDKRRNDIQWAFCVPKERQMCLQEDYCSPPKP